MPDISRFQVGLGIMADLEKESRLRSMFRFRDLAAVAEILVVKSGQFNFFISFIGGMVGRCL